MPILWMIGLASINLSVAPPKILSRGNAQTMTNHACGEHVSIETFLLGEIEHIQCSADPLLKL